MLRYRGEPEWVEKFAHHSLQQILHFCNCEQLFPNTSRTIRRGTELSDSSSGSCTLASFQKNIALLVPELHRHTRRRYFLSSLVLKRGATLTP
jgi:hypothetical protein